MIIYSANYWIKIRQLMKYGLLVKLKDNLYFTDLRLFAACAVEQTIMPSRCNSDKE